MTHDLHLGQFVQHIMYIEIPRVFLCDCLSSCAVSTDSGCCFFLACIFNKNRHCNYSIDNDDSISMLN